MMTKTSNIIRLLDARIYFRTWTGIVTLALIETGPDRGIAYDISTYHGGPKRTLGFELSLDRIDAGRVVDAGKQHAVRALEPPSNRAA